MVFLANVVLREVDSINTILSYGGPFDNHHPTLLNFLMKKMKEWLTSYY
jgi:hypothetical protein